MSRKPQLEEIDDDDIDNMDLDITKFDPNLKTPIAPLRPEPVITRSQDQEPPLFPPLPINNNMVPPAPVSSSGSKNSATDKDVLDTNKLSKEERDQIKKFQIVYPCYFDLNRSHAEGRRVSTDRAVENPLAKTVSDACRFFGLPAILELDKSHPQDFGNPGRVRVMLKDTDGVSLINPRYNNKRKLLNDIAQYLEDHPTTLDSVGTKSGIAVPSDFQGYVPEELPQVKGLRMNTIVPIHSYYTLKHPMTQSIYDPEPELPEQPQIKAPVPPKQQKKKVMKIRG
ncbi:signal recognition particle subunit [Scheffersomyces coipomensis]|uniref:signal recognition particle subunit n=1 Tax=Scheffersomyces coipomensis TaxID=1788519 RepID=UPI00315C61B3